jgi:hypothetical protein
MVFARGRAEDHEGIKKNYKEDCGDIRTNFS